MFNHLHPQSASSQVRKAEADLDYVDKVRLGHSVVVHEEPEAVEQRQYPVGGVVGHDGEELEPGSCVIVDRSNKGHVLVRVGKVGWVVSSSQELELDGHVEEHLRQCQQLRRSQELLHSRNPFVIVDVFSELVMLFLEFFWVPSFLN